MLNKINSNPLHREELLDIYSKRPNYGALNTKTHEASLKNPSCDDTINLEIEVEKGIIKNAKFSGQTCLISTISASILTGKIKGMKIEEVLKLGKSDIDKFLGTEVILTRAGCELLPLEAIKQALKNKK
jgi:nitrogen fixation NifU-like protein